MSGDTAKVAELYCWFLFLTRFFHSSLFIASSGGTLHVGLSSNEGRKKLCCKKCANTLVYASTKELMAHQFNLNTVYATVLATYQSSNCHTLINMLLDHI